MVEVIDWWKQVGETVWETALVNGDLSIGGEKNKFRVDFYPMHFGHTTEIGIYRSLEAAKMAAEIWYINRSKG